MSQVLDIRRKTAQERLRSDHIDLLQQLENYARENKELSDEIKRLEKQQDINHSPQNNSENSTSCDINISVKYEELMLSLNDTIQLQQNELKTLQTSHCIVLKASKDRIKDLQELLDSEISSKREMTSKMHEQSSHYQDLKNEYDRKIANMTNSCASIDTTLLDEKCAKLETLLEVTLNDKRLIESKYLLVTQEFEMSKQQRISESHQHIEEQNVKSTKIEKLQVENKDLCDEIEALKQALGWWQVTHQSCNRSSNCVSVNACSQTDDEESESHKPAVISFLTEGHLPLGVSSVRKNPVLCDSDDLDGRGRESNRNVVMSKSRCVNLDVESEEALEGEMDVDMSFANYIRLKRENITMKKQLLHVYGAIPGSIPTTNSASNGIGANRERIRRASSASDKTDKTPKTNTSRSSNEKQNPLCKC